MKGIILSVVVLLLMLAPVAGAGGKHIGDAAPLEITVEYLDAPGVLTIDERGATYYFPAWNWTYHAGGEYAPQYFGVYPVYFISRPVSYEVHIKNNSNRTYRNRKVVAIQEYHLADGARDGEVMPGDSTDEWLVEKIGPGEEIVLRGVAIPGWGTLPGLDQTHVEVFHWMNGTKVPVEVQMKSSRSPGKLFKDDPEAGLYCPPAFVLF
ncbi:MAG: hypothetical protein QXG38_01205 [Candidatus Hadarchaeales archaeon]